jgi:DNA-binding MarR family transcriptional regulator
VCLLVTPGASPQYRLGDLLALARASWIRQVRGRMDEIGYPGYRRTDAAILRLLGQHPRAIGELGDAMNISRQAARQLADGLVGRGYVTFGTDPADARRTLVALTPTGEEYARAVWQAQDALNEALRSRVTPADLAAAARVLRSILPETRRRGTEPEG